MMMSAIEKGDGPRWCILTTRGAQTLPLVAALSAAGIVAWTPTGFAQRLVRRGQGEKRTIPSPILPTVVFARYDQLTDIAIASKDPTTRYPNFAIYKLAGGVPSIRDASLSGLREAERLANEIHRAECEAKTREEKRRARAAALRTEYARRKALRSVHREFRIGATVDVVDAPAFAGQPGTVVVSTGKITKVRFGNMVMEIEAWRVNPVDVSDELTAVA